MNLQLNILYLIFVYENVFSTCEGLSPKRQTVRQFPDGFLFGSASSSYQVEGAWNEDGKGENIWDHFSHRIPSPISDNSTGDVAANSYHLYQRDVEMARELGLDFYRFSLSWARILPTGFSNKINQAGVDYYNNLINELLKYNIQPMVTLFHWDFPQRLQELGGWTNPHSEEWFGDYARVAFELFGDRVKYWITMNEPTQICAFGYGWGIFAPGISQSGIADYLCSKYVLLSHARAYHIYDEEFRPRQEGSIFITLSAGWYVPESETDIEAAEYYRQFDLAIYAHPIFSKTGDWPPMVKERIALKSEEQGFLRSRLPDLSEHEIDYLLGTSDYFGLNHYSTYMVNTNPTVVGNFAVPSRADDIGANDYQLDEWGLRQTDWTKYTPWGFYNLLTNIAESYDNPPIFITENGLGSEDFDLEDDNRVQYYTGYLGAVLDAVDNGVDIRGYTAWCLMDNFEWAMGYTMHFGLYYVDYTNRDLQRIPRQSAFVYKQIVETRRLDPANEPRAKVMTGKTKRRN